MDYRIKSEQIATLYRHMPVAIFASIFNSIITSLVMWNVANHRTVIIWLLVVLLIAAARIYVLFLYRTNVSEKYSGDLFEKWFMAGVFLSGLVWGIAGIIFQVEQIEYHVFLAIVILGLAAGSIATHSVHLPAFFTFFFLCLLPIVVTFLAKPDDIHRALGLMGVMFIIALSLYSRNVNHVFMESFRLRFENLDLVEGLTREKEAVERINRSKTRFLASASHDLRQPLHALSLFVSALQARMQGRKDLKLAKNIATSVDVLEGLLDSLLDISRLEAESFQPRMEAINLEAVFDAMRFEFLPLAQNKSLRLNVTGCGAVSVYSDRTLLERMLRNLLSNAVRYTQNGEVSLACDASADDVVIYVKDTGIGIGEDSREEIFGEFIQLGNHERDREKGLGLGLAIVAKIAELLDCKICLVSEPGQGSSFSFSLPVVDMPVAATTSIKEQPPGKALAGLRVLAIDDETTNLEALEELMAEWGCELFIANSLEDTWAIFARHDLCPDGVIADYRLRDNITGDTVLRKIEEHFRRKIPSILITGDLSVTSAPDIEGSDYRVLHKPIKPAQLRAFLNYAAGLRNAPASNHEGSE